MKHVMLICVIVILFNCCTNKLFVSNSTIKNTIAKDYQGYICNCSDSVAGGVKISNYKKPNTYSYFWYTIILRDSAEVQKVLPLSATINNHLLDSVPALENYYALLQQYSVYDSLAADSTKKFIPVGVSYFIKNKCSGYLPGTSAKMLYKKIIKPKFVKSLCK